MSDMRESIKNAIEEKIGNGDWNGISVEDGRYEGNLDTLDIDSESIEVQEVNLDESTITVTAAGSGSATHKDADSEDVSDYHDVSVIAKVNIDVKGASIVGIKNTSNDK
ncbi:hypothetical protein [Xanthomonas campestris]|uniref:hypothetical protein n=1 Tax=Xanthomonas campestris TaxID=339 RepID=UPI0012905301|nr:hypothetical protein [Xanthomonas campestris]